jgi:hypothetical protein
VKLRSSNPIYRRIIGESYKHDRLTGIPRGKVLITRKIVEREGARTYCIIAGADRKSLGWYLDNCDVSTSIIVKKGGFGYPHLLISNDRLILTSTN